MVLRHWGAGLGLDAGDALSSLYQCPVNEQSCVSLFALSLRDEAARAPVTLRASFTDRTLAWVSPWGRKKLISAPFLFHPQRFFEVLLLCQEGALKLALNGQAVGTTSLDQQTLERLRELQIRGSIQLYCVHY
ncbi:Galectin-12 [Sciurus carolinensis]|uniref:Galectin n=1 Tax=Sciurus carolinensis TaxID=30640 RepID=A0AA41N8Z7_SCICA|nr:Galectin-12 [Sciurus carolinensis]